MSYMTTTTYLLLTLTVAALKAANTAAGARVYGPRDWPTWRGEYPVLFVSMPSEDKESLGRTGATQFNVTGTIRVTGRVAALASPDDQGAGPALLAATALARQVEIAVINADSIVVDRSAPGQPFTRLQQFPFVRTQVAGRAQGKQHLIEAVLDIGMEFYQGLGDFAPDAPVPLEIVNIYTDLVNVFDPTGTYNTEPFTSGIAPAPRTSGPDGRPEGAGLTLPDLQS